MAAICIWQPADQLTSLLGSSNCGPARPALVRYAVTLQNSYQYISAHLGCSRHPCRATAILQEGLSDQACRSGSTLRHECAPCLTICATFKRKISLLLHIHRQIAVALTCLTSEQVTIIGDAQSV